MSIDRQYLLTSLLALRALIASAPDQQAVRASRNRLEVNG
jgi:hypothetical protein